VTLRFVVPVRNAGRQLDSCLRAIRASDAGSNEISVVFDGDASAEERAACTAFGADVLRSPGRGPAAARNAAVSAASEDLIFFVDADVQITASTPSRAVDVMCRTGAHAVAGAYTPRTSARGVLTRLKNLQHSYVHRANAGPVESFWAGCALISRRAFIEAGGFDETLRYCEDIELGARLSRRGLRVVFDDSVEAMHAKTYTPRSWMHSEVFGRARPWTSLILEGRVSPDVLNTGPSGRAGALVAVSTALGLVRSRSWRARLAVLAAGMVAEAAMHAGLVRFAREHDSAWTAALVGPYLLVHYALAGAGAAIAVAQRITE
jgi:GT2 family glycosyltransferase